MRLWQLLPLALALLITDERISHGAPAHGEARPYADGYSRPRALLHNPQDGLLYVALSTADQVAVIDVQRHPAQLVARIATGPFPQALSPMPGGDVLVTCRYDAHLGVIRRAPHTLAESDRYHSLPPLAVHGLREAVAHRSGRILVSLPALAGVQVLDREQGVIQTVATGLGPRTLRILRDPRGARDEELLAVSNFIDHSVDLYPLLGDGQLAPRAQRITTHAGVQDLLLLPPPQATLLLLTHEDRAVDRSEPFVAGMDSVVLALPARRDREGPPFLDAGLGRRTTVNLSDRRQPLVKLDGLAFDSRTQRLAIVGAASDRLLLAARTLGSTAAAEPSSASDESALRFLTRADSARTWATGNNPVAVAFLPDGRVATADRLSDTVSLLGGSGLRETVVVGNPARPGARERGELLFFSRALVPRNVATGARSLYSCSGCHDDGHVDGRLHPARQNRFVSMTKTCRSIGTTAPYLFLGEVANLADFSANLLATHAQGSERGPGFDRYSTTLQLPGRQRGTTTSLRLRPDQIRAAMTAYLASLPPEPSPFVPLGATVLPEPARRGLAVFKSACARCHRLVRDSRDADELPASDLERSLLLGQVALTGPDLHDVGIKVLGVGGNNAPSLRGVWDNAPYFSDGSARTLEEVVARASPDPSGAAVHTASGLSADEQSALLAFLRCL